MRGLPAGALFVALTAACATAPPAGPATPSSGPAPAEARTTGSGSAVVSVDRRFDVRWHRQLSRRPPLETSPMERSRPAWDAETGWVFVADRFGVLRALDPVGREQWTADFGAAVEAGLLLAGDTLFVTAVDGSVRALDRSTGRVLWTYQAGTELVTRPTLAGGRLFVPTLADSLIVLNASDGAFQWIHRRSRPEGLTIRGAARAVVEGDRVFAGFSDGTVLALRAEDGEVVWSRTVDERGRFRDVDATPVLAGGTLYVVTFGGRLAALNASDGSPAWEREVATGAVALERVGDQLIIAAGREVSAHRLLDGRPNWRTELTGGGPTEIVPSGDLVFLGTSGGPVYGLQVRSGRPFNAFAPGTGVSAPPVATAEGLWVWSNGGHLFRLTWR